jgi:ubiquinone/menaquinone biosynthesis C-methylase UbiE
MSESLNLKILPSEPCEIDFAWYDEIKRDLLRRTVGQARRVLDVGCGPGTYLLMLAPQIGNGIGIDISDEDLDRAERARKSQGIDDLTFRHADATALPFPDGSFDVALLLGDVLCYSNLYGKHGTVVAELRRVLVEGGIAVHESMNWDWEYRSYPGPWISFTRSGENGYTLSRAVRTASGLETSRNYEVLPGTPLHRWIQEQEWPVSPQGYNTALSVEEVVPIPQKWLEFRGVKRHKHYRPRGLRRLYVQTGFRHVEGFAYGQTYDIAVKAGLAEELGPLQARLARAEADLAFTLRLGSGPWLHLIAEK